MAKKKTEIVVVDVNSVKIGDQRVGTLLDAVANYPDLLEEIRVAMEDWDKHRLDELRADHQQKMKDRDDYHREQLGELQKKHSDKVAALEKSRDDLASKHSNEMTKLKNEHGKVLAKVKAEAARDQQQLKDRHAQSVEDLTGQIKALGTTRQARQIQEKQKRQQLEKTIKAAQTELRKLMADT